MDITAKHQIVSSNSILTYLCIAAMVWLRLAKEGSVEGEGDGVFCRSEGTIQLNCSVFGIAETQCGFVWTHTVSLMVWFGDSQLPVCSRHLVRWSKFRYAQNFNFSSGCVMPSTVQMVHTQVG